MIMNNLKLVYVNPVGKNATGNFEYDFFFSETPDIVWGENWEMQCPAACGDMKPDETTYSFVKRIVTSIPFSCAQENACLSMQDCIDGCIAVFYENISEYEEYPSPYRIVCRFGEDYDSVIDKLKGRNVDV